MSRAKQTFRVMFPGTASRLCQPLHQNTLRPTSLAPSISSSIQPQPDNTGANHHQSQRSWLWHRYRVPPVLSVLPVLRPRVSRLFRAALSERRGRWHQRRQKEQRYPDSLQQLQIDHLNHNCALAIRKQDGDRHGITQVIDPPTFSALRYVIA